MPLPDFHFVKDAPKPVGPFCHATEIDGWIFLTGQMPTFPDDPNKPIPQGIDAQTRQVFDNLRRVLTGLGLDLENVVQCRCYLAEFERDFAAFNWVYRSYFDAEHLPARTTIGVTALAVGALVEIDMVAKRP
ncbi:RidA family protein [Pseudoruegeria sp. SK021]|uniref:RidA family protein n=1 Tax=Pseudoruegeria sp. SK021 TaxID=1933035 RepID=UPI000A260937|nr:RidA family protein [Pseudoruegeria sp. SK021]OSP53831.1 reactive intermediate/imine deaminase [Pseudoruegeria sp. SK021]